MKELIFDTRKNIRIDEVVPKDYPWRVAILPEDSVYFQNLIERTMRDRRLSANEILWGSYLSYKENCLLTKSIYFATLEFMKEGSLPFMYLFSLFYETGYLLVDKNLPRALALRAYLVEHQFKDAIYDYLSLFLETPHVEEELLRARHYLETLGSPCDDQRRYQAVINLRLEVDVMKSLSLLRHLERLNDSQSAYYLGEFYLARQDYSRAFHHYVIGASLQHPQCLRKCGYMAYWGKGTAKDDILALAYFMDCKDDSDCLCLTGEILQSHPELDQDKMLDSYRLAYHLGSLRAAKHLIPLLKGTPEGRKIELEVKDWLRDHPEKDNL